MMRMLQVWKVPISESQWVTGFNGCTSTGAQDVGDVVEEQSIPLAINEFYRFIGTRWGVFLWNIIAWSGTSFGVPACNTSDMGREVVWSYGSIRAAQPFASKSVIFTVLWLISHLHSHLAILVITFAYSLSWTLCKDPYSLNMTTRVRSNKSWTDSMGTLDYVWAGLIVVLYHMDTYIQSS